jgi:hypothetical protein
LSFVEVGFCTAGDVDRVDGFASAASFVACSFAQAFFCLDPVRPVPPLSRGIKVHLQADTQQAR